MIGLKNLYKVFQETRKSSREHATLAVTGESPRAVEIATVLGAQREVRGAEIILNVLNGGERMTLSGKAIEEPDEIIVPPAGEKLFEELAQKIVHALDEEYLVPLGRGYPGFRRAVCGEVIRSNARQNAFIGALPIPGADMPVMTANQGRMVLNIAAIYGEELSLDRARELIGVLAAGFGLRALGRQVVKLIPIGGWAAASVIGYAGTLAMGRATMLYFERGKQEVGQKEMAEIRQRAIKEAEAVVSRFRNR